MRKRRAHKTIIGVLLLLLTAVYLFVYFECRDWISSPVILTVDDTRRYQTIEGFGGFGAKAVWWADPPFWDKQFISRLIDGLGLTILRDNIPIGFEPENDDDNPRNFNWSAFNTSVLSKDADSVVDDHIEYLSAMHALGLQKLIVSIWSPPLWMKHTSKRGNGLPKGENSAPDYIDQPSPGVEVNQLRRAYFQEFAEYCAAYIKLIKARAGLDVYAISLQNEPRFSQWYASAVYSPEALATLIAVVGKRFDDEGIDTKIFAPEDVASFSHINAYLQAIANNKEALEYTDIFAIHNYKNDGVSSADTGPIKWQKTARIAAQHAKKVWMTETSGRDGDDIVGVVAYVGSIYNALKYGGVSAWVHWQLSGDRKSTFLSNDRPKLIFYFAKHYYRHVRPGYIRVKVDGESKQLKALGFVSAENDELVLVLTNFSKKPRSVKLNHIELSSSACWMSSAQLRHERVTCPKAEETLTMPAQAIMTIVSSM